MITVNLNLQVTAVIPAYNESEFIGRVLATAQEVEEVDEILVVDDGSGDDTATIAEGMGARVISHETNMGKGRAMETGAREAKGDILVYLDADLQNITPKKVRLLLEPFRDGYDFAKSRFDRRSGRVTQLTAKPLLGRFFPDISNEIEQPLSGQIAIRRDLMNTLELEPDMGVDIGILIDAFEKGARIKQVYFGSLEHDSRDLADLNSMAKAVSRVILDRANRYHRLNEAIEDLTLEV